MYKKFVSLNSNQSPSKNPYEVRTFMGEPLKPQHPEWRTETCGYQRECLPLNSTITKEDEKRSYPKKLNDNVYLRPFKKFCKYEDHFVTCVVPQRTPDQLKRNAVMREKYIKAKHDMNEIVHDAGDIYADHESFIKLDDPFERASPDEEGDEHENESEGVILPEIASPQCSMDYIYVPPQQLLELNRPKSGLYINETQPPNFYPSDEIPYSTYNPRHLQEQFDAQYLKKIDVITGKSSKDLWTWNVGIQQRESELDREFIEAAVPKFDCNNVELAAYKIPNDLDKTFSAGIVFGTKAVVPESPPRKKARYNRPLEMACLYLAYVEGFRLNTDFWTAQTMDNILKMGQKLIQQCIKMNYKSTDNDFDIIPQIKERQATINIKVHFTGPWKSEPNIYKSLALYFSKYNTGILCCNNLHLLIWKRCKNFYYIYDPNGRSENCERDFEGGKSALMSTHYVEHLVHLIVNLSHINAQDEFNLYEIYLESYGSIPKPLDTKPYPKIYHKKWMVVNSSYAVIPGCNNGLFQPRLGKEHNSSMLISVMALLYAHIERANNWKIEQIDELIRLGNAYYKSLRSKLKLKDNQHVTIMELPEKYVLGLYKASLKKIPFVYTGTVTDYCKKFTDSLLTLGMKELFSNQGEAAGLIQIDNSVLAVWKDYELFYLYDPFRRGKAGQVLDPEDYKTNGTPILQIHANFESLLRVLYQNSLKMRRGGTFFLHALRVGCIKPIMDGKERKLRYTKLKLAPETYEKDVTDNEINDEKEEGGEEKKLKKEKTKDKKKPHKPEKVCSIESLDDKESFPIYNNSEVVEDVLEHIICDIINEFPEPLIARPHLYKQANRVLLRTDKPYLEKLKYLLKHSEDYDNIEKMYQSEAEPNTPLITVEEELQIPSNFGTLPDGSWIIFGTQPITSSDDEQLKRQGLLSALITVALTAKYKISSWSSKLIDFVAKMIDNFGEDFHTYQYTLGALLHNNLPKLALGERTYQVKVEKLYQSSDIKKPLRQVLLQSLIDFQRILVICQRFCCLIVKRYNFVYMFMGFPSNTVGYRQFTPGPACLLRFIELDSLIRRIEFGCNPQGCDITQYVVIPVKVADVTTTEPTGRYRQWPANVQDRMNRSAVEEKTREEESKRSKMQFLEEELRLETQRIEKFQEEKAGKMGQEKVKTTKGRQGSKKSGQSNSLNQREMGGEDLEDDSQECGESEEGEVGNKKEKSTKERRRIRKTDGPSTWLNQRNLGGEDQENVSNNQDGVENEDENDKAINGQNKADPTKTTETKKTDSQITLINRRELAGEDIEKKQEEVKGNEEEEDEECSVPPKHIFGTEIPTDKGVCNRPRPQLYGYRLREKDLLYKIQGSKALEGRNICEIEKLKPCLIASTLANLSVILKPHNEWSSQHIDQVIDSSRIIYDTIEDPRNSEERIIKNITIDDYKFDICIKDHLPIGLIGNIEQQLDRITSQRKYLILQTYNCSYAIYHDEYYHLFDPYPSMELSEMENKEGEDNQQTKDKVKRNLNYPKGTQIYGERNTASWILFADIVSLINYVHERSCNSNWQEKDEYTFIVVDIISYKKSPINKVILQLLTGMDRCNISNQEENVICTHNESLAWLDNCLPLWSRLNRRNTSGHYRKMSVSKLKKYDIEIDKRLWSLWGNLHPFAPVFPEHTRGKQYLACHVLAICAAQLYSLINWSPQLLDSIVVNGDRYFQESIVNIKCQDFQLSLEDLNCNCSLDNIKFRVHLEAVTFGKLYSRPYYNRMNLAEALIYFFNNHRFGILQCFKKCLAIGFIPGHDGGYFMYDCQSRDHPLFPSGQGASYVLRTKYLQILLYCIVVTLNIRYYNVQFTLHKVNVVLEDQMKEGQGMEYGENMSESHVVYRSVTRRTV